MLRKVQEKWLHRVHTTITTGTQTGALFPTHHLQQLVANVVIVLAWSWGSGRWGGREWWSFSKSFLLRDCIDVFG